VNRPRAHTFRGRRYKIKWRKPRDPSKDCKMTNQGYCTDPKNANPTMAIDPNLCEETLLKVAIDEAIHATFWDLDNDAVDEAATDIASFLRRVGFGLAGK
jgi:hypothetical protein